MRQELRERREKTWDLLVVKGLQYKTVCDRLADEYGVRPNTIEKDIGRMNNWLPKLDSVASKSAVSRLKELRENRQRLHQMALEAQRDGDPKTELRVRKTINKAIEDDINLSQSVGLTDERPQRVEVDGEHAVRNLPPETEQLYDEWTGHTTEEGDDDE